MPRHRSFAQLDDPPATPGDTGFVGVGAAISPDQLPPRIAASATNMRFRGQVAGTRRGIDKVIWGQRTDSFAGQRFPLPWTDAHALTVFRDPASVEWILLASEDRIWRIRVNNEPVALAQPDTVWFGAPVSFVQAFGRMYCHRGNHRRPLVMTSIEGGWSYLVPTWNPANDYALDDVVIWGPWTTEAVGALVVSGTSATLTMAGPHGLIPGSELSIKGTTLPSDYQGTFRVSILDSKTVQFTHHGDGTADPGHTLDWTTHTAAWKSVAPLGAYLGDEPATSALKWTRTYTVLPNGLNGAFINGRLLVPTSWIPGQTGTDAGGYAAKTDYVAAADVSNPSRFTVANEFRINQGSADELLALARGGPRDVVCFKGSTIHLLRNLAGDLSGLSLDTLRSAYGIANPRAFTQVGRDLVFMAPGRGVCTLTQSATGEIQGVDVPLSQPVQGFINRINWRLAQGIRMAFWSNRLYVALPIDDGVSLGASQLPPLPSVKSESLSIALYLRAGTEYEWQPGADAMDQLEVNGRMLTPQDGPQRFVYDGGGANLRYLGTPDPLDAYVVNSRIRPVRRGNNALLIFDYELPPTQGDEGAWRAFHPAGQWSGLDSGPDVAVREFAVATVHGRERLLAITSDGWLSLLEASDDGDWTRPAFPWLSLQVMEPINTELVTRGYSADPSSMARGIRAVVALGTWSPKYSVAVLTDGISEERVVRKNVTRSRTKICRPAWAPRFNPFAAGARHDQPWREDYSVIADPALSADSDEITSDTTDYTVDSGPVGLDVGPAGLPADRLQELTDQMLLPSLPGRWAQLRITNTQGRIEVRAAGLETIPGDRADNTKI